MRKFIVQTTRDGQTSIIEVEIELIQAVEDQSVMWLPKEEYKARIIAPKSLYEKQEDGSLAPPVWYSHAFCWTIYQARVYADRVVRSLFEQELRHHGTVYTEQQVQQKLSEIQEVKLP